MKNTNKKKSEPEKPDVSKILKEDELVVATSIISRLMNKFRITESEARMVFNSSVESGAIIQAGIAGIYPGIKIYKKR